MGPQSCSPYLVLFLTACGYGRPVTAERPSAPISETPLDVTEVIHESTSLFGKEILVSGYLVLEFENINLFRSYADYKVNNYNCISMGVNDVLRRESKKRNHTTVIIRGLLKEDYFSPNIICTSCCTRYAIVPIAFVGN